jgi:hypothetical protein
MFDLNTYQANDGELFAGSSAEEVLKAMQAGLGTGRDYNNQTHVGEGLKVESLDPVVKVLTNKMEHLNLWKMIPKQKIYNTVHEYNQLIKYGNKVGIFNQEGETPQFTDSQYRRKSVITKFMGVGGQVTHPAMLVKRADGKDPLAVEVENKTMLLLTEINKLIVSADDSKIDTQFSGLFRQHMTGIADIYGGITGMTSEALLDAYFGDLAIINASGSILTDALVEDAADVAVNRRKGMISDIISTPTVFNNYVKQFHESKRVLVNNPLEATMGATMGQKVNKIQTQFGPIDIKYDIYFDERTPKAYNEAADSDKAPNAPTIGGAPIAVNTDTKTKFAGFASGYFYIVTAKNRYGESTPLAINTSIQAVAATESVDIQFSATASPYATESYVVYRTVAGVTDRTTASYYPIFEVSLAELAAGFDGAAATKVRDRNRFIPNTHSAMVMYNSPEFWEYLQLAPTMRMDFAINSPSRRFSVLNYGTPVLYQPGKWVRVVNIGATVPA